MKIIVAKKYTKRHGVTPYLPFSSTLFRTVCCLYRRRLKIRDILKSERFTIRATAHAA